MIVLDIGRMSFVEGPDLPTPVESPAVVVSNSSVYIIGGYSKTKRLAGTQLSTIYKDLTIDRIRCSVLEAAINILYCITQLLIRLVSCILVNIVLLNLYASSI